MIFPKAQRYRLTEENGLYAVEKMMEGAWVRLAENLSKEDADYIMREVK